MVLEATLLCLDNSDWTRNGDYYPSRFQTQVEAANLIIENRCESNRENSMGIMSMAGKRVEMVATLTNDESLLLGAMSHIHLNGECDLISALSIAILCLKHRINKNQKQRIILFVGSPIRAKKENLVQIGKKLKKYNVAVDVISFGHVDENRELIETLIKEVNNQGNSSIMEVPIGSFIMETLLNSPIMGMGPVNEGQGGQPQPNQGGNNHEPIGLSQFERDMNLALEMSLKEAQKNDNKGQNNTNTGNINAEAEKAKTKEELEEEKELENARLLSIQENNKIIQKENEEKEKKAANEILKSPDFLDDLLKQVNEGDQKKENEKKDDKKEDNKDKKEEEKKDEKKDDKKDKMDIDK